MSIKAKVLTALILLMILDILPVPVIGLLLLYVVLKRPAWFRETVRRLYEENEQPARIRDS